MRLYRYVCEHTDLNKDIDTIPEPSNTGFSPCLGIFLKAYFLKKGTFLISKMKALKYEWNYFQKYRVIIFINYPILTICTPYLIVPPKKKFLILKYNKITLFYPIFICQILLHLKTNF